MAQQFVLNLEEVEKAINQVALIGTTIQGDMKFMQTIVEPVYKPQNMASKTIAQLKKYFDETLIPTADRAQKDIAVAQADLLQYLREVKETLEV